MTLVWDAELAAGEKLVLLALADCADDEGHCWPSIATLVRKTGQSERTVQKMLKALEEDGHISRDQRAGRGCFYTIHPRKICTPAKSAPPQKLHQTPAKSAPKPSRTVKDTLSNERASKRATPAKVDPFPCPEGVDLIDWQALLANRKAKRAALTPGAHRAIVKKLDAWAADGWPPGPIVANAAERGWTSVFPTDEMKEPRNDRQPHPHRAAESAGLGKTGAAFAALRDMLDHDGKARTGTGAGPMRNVTPRAGFG